MILVCVFAFAAFAFVFARFLPLNFQSIYPFLPVCFLMGVMLFAADVGFFTKSVSKRSLISILFNGLFLIYVYDCPKLRNEDSTSTSSSSTITFLIWNAQQFNNDTAIVEASIAKIREVSPDVILLQEFGLYYKWPDTESVAADFAKRAGFNYWDFTPKRGDIFGTACFSKWPITQIEVVFQSPNSTNEAKGYSIALIDDTIDVINAHLMSYNIHGDTVKNVGEFSNIWSDRLHQSSLILSRQASFYCGDFNSAPGDLVYRNFHAIANDAFSGSLQPTHKWLPARLDHFFMNSEWQVLQAEVLTHYPSDHHALHVEVRRQD